MCTPHFVPLISQWTFGYSHFLNCLFFGPSATSFDSIFLWYGVDFSLKHPFNLPSASLAHFGCFLFRNEAQEEIYKKGQSRRIWGELYKVSL